jgi:hypothetical protein
MSIKKRKGEREREREIRESVIKWAGVKNERGLKKR